MISKKQLLAGVENALISGRFSRKDRNSNKENRFRPEKVVQKVHYKDLFINFEILHLQNLNITSRRKLIYQIFPPQSQGIQGLGIRK
jgi:hypothetical protein